MPRTVAIVGAPNVGKSTLFNRLVGRRRAIVTDQPGVTRDRIYGEVQSDTLRLRLVDTGGLAADPSVPFAAEIAQQVELALEEASAVLLVVDGRRSPSAFDVELASRLRRSGLSVVVVANKIDSERAAWSASELYELGLGAPVAVSAEHGLGIGELLERLDAALDPSAPAESVDAEERADATVRLALVGRPNVGKSSLFNRLVGAERAIVSDVPGTTRDSVDTLLQLGSRSYRIVDTAGLRRRAKVTEDAERLAASHARRSLEACDVALLVLDATTDFTAQDAHVAGEIVAAHKPLVVAVNKWDAVAEPATAVERWNDLLARRLGFLHAPPIVHVSAHTGRNVRVLLEQAERLHARSGTRVPTPTLNRWLAELREAPGGGALAGRGFKLYYATQNAVRPPTFVLFCNDPRRATAALRRHLEHALRARFDLGPVPLRLRFRGRERA